MTTPTRHKVTYAVPPKRRLSIASIRSWLAPMRLMTRDGICEMNMRLAKRRQALIAKVRREQASSDGLYLDPDTVAGEAHVSEWQDARNSRPEPY